MKTTTHSMKLTEMKNDIEIMIQMEVLEQGLDLTPTSHDRHFVKHVTNMNPIGLNNIFEHSGLKLI